MSLLDSSLIRCYGFDLHDSLFPSMNRLNRAELIFFFTLGGSKEEFFLLEAIYGIQKVTLIVGELLAESL